MKIEKIGNLLIKALENANYNESTVFNYKGVLRRFKTFCDESGTEEYSPEIGSEYANALISPKTGKYSPQRHFSQMRFIRFLDSYVENGFFIFGDMKRGRLKPSNISFIAEYEKFQSFLRSEYENENTIHYYEYGMYRLVQFMDETGVGNLESLKPDFIMKYFMQTKEARKRAVLCELRCIFRYLDRDDLVDAIAGIHAPRRIRIIPMLTEREQKNLQTIIESEDFLKRDRAIIMLGLTSGMRAIDVINLKLSDINWTDETISFRQSKTGNYVYLPLISSVGNAIVEYITIERPDVRSEYLFLSETIPHLPLQDHSSCYYIVKRCFEKAGIEKKNRIFGMHMLRHNVASTMVRNEVPIETIAAILGHSTPDSTDIYITTDEERLKSCVLPLAILSEGGLAW
ncbi:MAG: tyrosine-type recombinase/integrase [Sphaerochaetaceae bacterium]|nr:tyrosine-type recombinase/integrase [Sphaerochaetaceae bacterium]